jgi:hypothetical protein
VSMFSEKVLVSVLGRDMAGEGIPTELCALNKESRCCCLVPNHLSSVPGQSLRDFIHCGRRVSEYWYTSLCVQAH